MLGIHTQTRPVIIQALWQYVKTHKLQDPHEREFINCDKYLQQVSSRFIYTLELVKAYNFLFEIDQMRLLLTYEYKI